MSKVQFITHDVTQTLTGVVAHGCNCQGVMGSGVALAIRRKWPIAFRRYLSMATAHQQAYPSDTGGLLGRSIIVNVGDSDKLATNTLFVANLFTQNYYGKDGRVYADVEAIRMGLRTAMVFCEGAKLPLYMPRIGCGLGGLSWDRDVSPIVDELVQGHDVDVYVCDWP